jgi:glycosyltransferase involved in cell wall biosynthesis
LPIFIWKKRLKGDNSIQTYGRPLGESDSLEQEQVVAEPSCCELSIIMPCLNEAPTLAVCIKKAHAFLKSYNIHGEIIVADNGSTDASQAIAEDHGARVVNVSERGYGAALAGGINAARGKYLIMGDADDSYDFKALAPFVEKLREGHELVMGNRFMGGITPGAMPNLNRYLGNPVLTGLGRLFFRSPSGDFHCGLRGFSKEAIQRLDLQTTGMEFASEMVVKATLHKLRIAEVSVSLSPDGRDHPPHLQRWRDGWRHCDFFCSTVPLALLISGHDNGNTRSVGYGRLIVRSDNHRRSNF